MKFLGRDAVQLENEALRVTLLTEGCHIAEIFHKKAAINPLWIPPWSVPNADDRASGKSGQTYGPDTHVLSGVMGHHICLDLFGEPSETERAAGFEMHGEACLVPYTCQIANDEIHATAHLKRSSLRLSRSIRLGLDGSSVIICETVRNLLSIDRPIAWTQHVTLGPPFLIPGVTRIHIDSARSRVCETGSENSHLEPGADFTWPEAPSRDKRVHDLSIFADQDRSSSLTAHRMEGDGSEVGFTAFCPLRNLLFGYNWNSRDFPWLAMWEENKSRCDAPWNRETIACGLEFGVSPFPQSRRQMVERGLLFNTPTFRWLGANAEVSVSYSAFIRSVDQPETRAKER